MVTHTRLPLETDRAAAVRRRHLVVADGDGGGLTAPGTAALLAAVLAAAEGEVITLGGNGATFCAGLDLRLLTDDRRGDGPASLLGTYQRLLLALESAPCPVVALVDGAAQGGGVGLAAAADIVLATPRATFALPEVYLGLAPAVVLPVLARRVGPAHARRLALGHRPLDAVEAARLGLVDEVAADLEAGLALHLKRLGRADPRAVAEVRSLSAALGGPDPDYAARALKTFGDLAARTESRERIARFQAGDSPWPARGGA